MQKRQKRAYVYNDARLQFDDLETQQRANEKKRLKFKLKRINKITKHVKHILSYCRSPNKRSNYSILLAPEEQFLQVS